jgi:hypothetical protein
VEIRRPSGLPKEFLAGESLRCTCCHDPLPGTSSRTRKDTFRDSFKHLCWGRSARISILANGKATVCARASLNLRPHSAGRLIPLPVLQLHYKATVEKARNIAFFTPAHTESLV